MERGDGEQAQPEVALRARQAEDLLFAAVTDPQRRQLITILADRGPIGPTALAAAMPVTRQAVSKHLAALERAGLVVSRRRGREALYRVRPQRLRTAAAALAHQAAAWDEAARRR